MFKLNRLILLLSLLFFFINPSNAQKDRGISKKDLTMKIYEPDTAAEAVVLHDKGHISFNYDGGVTLERKRQVKILKQKGVTEHGTFSMTLDANYQRMVFLEARIIQPDSSIVKLTEQNIFYEKINDDRTVLKVIFPDVKEGSITELTYEMAMASIELFKWSFQENIPVRRSMLIMNIPQWVECEYLIKGVLNYKTGFTEVKSMFGDYTELPVVMIDTVPAFSEEILMPSLKDMSSSLTMKWKKLSIPNSKKVIHNDWNFMNNICIESKKFGEQIDKKSNYGDIWKVLKPLIANAKSSEDTLKVVYDYISNNIEWIDNFFSPFVEKTLENSFKKKRANSGEMNLMMVACLREAGVTCFPLLVSTFENGTPSPDYSSVFQFDHVLCYAQMNNKEYFLDAGSHAFRNIYLPRRVS